MIVGPNGKSTHSVTIKYKVGNVVLDTNATPADKLQQALEGARQMAQMQLAAAARQQASASGLHLSAEGIRIQAIAEASKIVDPFQMEPCAQAVFMLLATEIAERNAVIEKLKERIDKLECSSKPEASLLEAGRQD